MKTSELFTLEALDAKEGDALLLHYGSSNAPKLILIDGGPAGVYKATLKKRLAAIGGQLGADAIELRHIFVTHLDSDHIRGVLDLAGNMGDPDCPAQSDSFWLNVFDDTLLAQLPAATASAMQDAPTTEIQADTASIKEGASLMDAITQLKAVRNGGAPVLVADGKGKRLDLGEAELEVTLVCPDLVHLRKLADEWQKSSKKKAETAEYVDTSVYNLSSLVMVVDAKHADGRRGRMLLTGDARGDHIIAGLGNAGFLDENGKAHFDILKVPHHGSDRNLTAEFFQTIQARHYVISANGRHANPSEEVLEWIADGAQDDDYVLWLTNRSDPLYNDLEKNVATALKSHPALKKHLRYREEDDPSIRVDLFDPVAY